MATEELDYEIRQMKREEIPDALDLWRETDLSEGTHSLETWYEYDPEGFYVAVMNDGTVIGVCAGILQHSDLAFIGMYAVKSTYRGRGVGRKIWNRVMERIGDRNAGVNPVPEQLENYRDRAGFPIQSDWCSVVCVAKEVNTSEMLTELPEIDICSVSPNDEEMINAVAEYDTGVFGFSRGSLISMHCKETDTVTVVAKNSCNNSVCGYGTIKENIKGNSLIGPLFADDDSIAELILYHLIKAFPRAQSEGVTLMTIDCNQDALGMIEKLGFKKKTGTARLYRSAEVDVQFNKVFGQHNLNFSVF